MKEHSAVPLALEPAAPPARGRRRLQAGRHITPYLLLIPALAVPDGKRVGCIITEITPSGARSFVAVDGRAHEPFFQVFGPLRFSPDGRRLAYVARSSEGENSFVVLDGAAQEPLGEVQFATQRQSRLTFSVDGKSLVYVVERVGMPLAVVVELQR